jgi:hypothetical protein
MLDSAIATSAPTACVIFRSLAAALHGKPGIQEQGVLVMSADGRAVEFVVVRVAGLCAH